MKYCKKPVIIDAVIWDGLNKVEIEKFCGQSAEFELYNSGYIAGVTSVGYDLYIKTLEGTRHASVGDYIIKGVKGEFYPCKPDIFRATYDAVTPEQSKAEVIALLKAVDERYITGIAKTLAVSVDKGVTELTSMVLGSLKVFNLVTPRKTFKSKNGELYFIVRPKSPVYQDLLFVIHTDGLVSVSFNRALDRLTIPENELLRDCKNKLKEITAI